MHSQPGTVGSPEFNGEVLKFEVTLRLSEPLTAEITDLPGSHSAVSADIADLILEMFEENLKPEFIPEVGVRTL